jgi:hypothetical protein
MLRRNFMNALQIIPPKATTRMRQSALLFRVAVMIVLLALGRISMSRGDDRIASEPDALAEVKYSRDKVDDNDKSLSVTQPVAATAEDSRSAGSEEKETTPAQPAAQSSTSAAGGVSNDPKGGSEPASPAPPEAKSDAASGAAVDDGTTRDRNSGSAVPKPPASAASVAPKSDLAPKSEDVRVRKATADGGARRAAGPVRPAYQPQGQADYRGWKSADAVPARAGPPPVIYGPGPEARAPYAVGPADGAKRPDRMSLATLRGTWERVVEAPGAVLSSGKQALYGVLDSIW